MTGRAWLWMGLWLGLCAGCGDDAGEGPAAEPEPGAGGGEPDRDAGRIWMPRDASTWDSGTTTAMGVDSGIEGRECAMARMPLPDALLPRCEPATRSCVAQCAGATDPDTCRDTCINADDSPAETMLGLDCGACIYLQLFACIDQAGCHDGVAELFCCIDDRCPPGSPENCTEQRCSAELDAAVTCGYFADMSCLDFLTGAIDQCYAPEPDVDAGS